MFIDLKLGCNRKKSRSRCTLVRRFPKTFENVILFSFRIVNYENVKRVSCKVRLTIKRNLQYFTDVDIFIGFGKDMWRYDGMDAVRHRIQLHLFHSENLMSLVV